MLQRTNLLSTFSTIRCVCLSWSVNIKKIGRLEITEDRASVHTPLRNLSRNNRLERSARFKNRSMEFSKFSRLPFSFVTLWLVSGHLRSLSPKPAITCLSRPPLAFPSGPVDTSVGRVHAGSTVENPIYIYIHIYLGETEEEIPSAGDRENMEEQSGRIRRQPGKRR